MSAPLRRPPSRVGVFTAGYLSLFTAWCAARGDRRIVAYLLVAGAVAVVLRRAHRVARFSGRLCAALAGCGLLHMVGGLVPSPSGPGVFYDTWLVTGLLKYDQLVHFTASAVVTVALWRLCAHWCDPERCGPWARAVLAMVAALGFGALNEGFEFLSALRFPNYVGGLENTGWDLVFNAFGAATAAAVLAASTPAASSEEARRRPATADA